VSTARDYLPDLTVGGVFDLSLDRATTAVVAMLGLDALWWVLLWDGHVPMPGTTWLMQEATVPMAAPGAMELGVFHVGTLGAVIDYTVMWGVMMWAMMHPPMARFTRDYTAAHRGSATQTALSVTSFLTSYHIVWALSAVIPLGVHLLLPGGIHGFTRAHTHLVIGGVLALTGLYQLTAFKQRLLRDCCGTVVPHADDIPQAFREGAWHGTRCLLICFAPFFLLMPFFGEMNFFWMVALTTVVTVERLPTWGRETAVATGIVALLAGLFVLLVQPDLPISFTMSMGM
jgi:predicted metal-binding membrane protein